MCRTCAEQHSGTNFGTELQCTHTEKERSSVTTTNSYELKMALEKGYKCTRIYHAYKFDQVSQDLFKEYIFKYLKIKLESSGKPYETAAENNRYKVEVKRRFGVELDDEKWHKNNALRSTSKLFLNSLWGRLAMRPNLPSVSDQNY